MNHQQAHHVFAHQQPFSMPFAFDMGPSTLLDDTTFDMQPAGPGLRDAVAPWQRMYYNGGQQLHNHVRPEQLLHAEPLPLATSHYVPAPHPPAAPRPLQQHHRQQRTPVQHGFQQQTHTGLTAQQYAQFQILMASHNQSSQQPSQPSPQHSAASSIPPPPPTEEELAVLQKLSSEYEPEVTGPLVSVRQPSTALTAEYAAADPIYQAKTIALPQKYSHYRTVRGDGRCGWRAVAFGYFEALIHHGLASHLSEEETRLRSLSNVLNAAGFDPMLYEDFADETFELLRNLHVALTQGNAEVVLLATFNNEELQNLIIAHLKTLTTAWMKTHEHDYSPWLLGQTVEEYTNLQVMPIASEIDHVGLSALKDVLLSPAGIALEILYLDRSEGSEVNEHCFEPAEGSSIVVGYVRLLYRPGHYDILYKPQDVTPLPASVPVYSQYDNHLDENPITSIEVSDFLAHVPGMSLVPPPTAWLPGPGFESPDVPMSSTSPMHQTIPRVPALIPHRSIHQDSSRYFFLHSEPQVQPLVHDLVLRRKPSDPTPAVIPTPTFQSVNVFRPSQYELDPDIFYATSQVPLRTRAFQNSHFNTAHFMNPSFHPEQWRPEDEFLSRNRSRSPRSSRLRD